MSSSPDEKFNQRLGKISISKVVQDVINNDMITDDQRLCETRPLITNLPEDCLSFIFQRLDTKEDRNAFGLTCHRLFHIQNKNCQKLWYWYSNRMNPKSSPLVKLLIRFQNLKYLALEASPKITAYAASKSQSFGSEVEILDLDYCSKYSYVEFSLIFSWFPHLVNVSLKHCHITDKGLEDLAECCSSIEEVDLSWCDLITDSGISYLIRSCRELDTLDINFCSKITGIGFLGCSHTLTKLDANGCKLTPEGINAIVSGGGIKYLTLSTPDGLSEVGEGSMNMEAVLTILKGCPLLQKLFISDFVEVINPEGWEVIRQNCKSLKRLRLYGCHKLGKLGWQALIDGCVNLCL